jgi:SOS-response transcriptional repressor LexA
MELQAKQQEILQAIEDMVRVQGYPPTVREIGAAVGLSSPASVQGHLGTLESLGYIRRGSSKRRALEVVRRAIDGAPVRGGTFLASWSRGVTVSRCASRGRPW